MGLRDLKVEVDSLNDFQISNTVCDWHLTEMTTPWRRSCGWTHICTQEE